MKANLKKILKISLLLIVAISLLISIIAINGYLKDEKLLFYATGTQYKAFLNSTWEMSEKEIERANDTYLRSEPARFDFSGFDTIDGKINPPGTYVEYNPFILDLHLPKVLNMSRYKKRIQNDITIFGYNSRVRYYFFDDKLFEYTLIIHGLDADKFHKQIYSSISEKFGEGRVQENENFQIQSVSWENSDLKVDYWLNDILNSFTGKVRFSYKPTINKIKQIKLNEEKNLF